MILSDVFSILFLICVIFPKSVGFQFQYMLYNIWYTISDISIHFINSFLLSIVSN